MDKEQAPKIACESLDRTENSNGTERNKDDHLLTEIQPYLMVLGVGFTHADLQLGSRQEKPVKPR